MISWEFPNTGFLINETNNILYWQNLEDGNAVYSITITPGNYTSPTDFTNEIQEKCALISRLNASIIHDIRVSINTSTHKISFKNVITVESSNPLSFVRDADNNRTRVTYDLTKKIVEDNTIEKVSIMIKNLCSNPNKF